MEEGKEKQELVCIVDDNADIREIYSAKFRREGFSVVTARDGVEALAVIRKEHPDVILLDIQMPVLDGLEVLKTLKEDAELAKIPVVVLSNVESEEILEQVSALHEAHYYLIKSLTDPQHIVDVTLKALAERP
jgi:chemosensory pili system protein ChpA (sensor histidine kinase/response regulator)